MINLTSLFSSETVPVFPKDLMASLWVKTATASKIREQSWLLVHYVVRWLIILIIYAYFSRSLDMKILLLRMKKIFVIAILAECQILLSLSFARKSTSLQKSWNLFASIWQSAKKYLHRRFEKSRQELKVYHMNISYR